MKSISTAIPAITENTESTVTIAKERTQLLIEKWVCHIDTVYHYTSFRFQLFERLANIPSKE